MNKKDGVGAQRGALSGVRVLDLTGVLMGPYATQLLGDMGADVVKVEPPKGDTSRGIGPFRNPGMGPGFIHVNRNKRSICIDLKTEDGRATLLDLARNTDILVYNVRPAAMARLRLSYADLAEVNPRIIYAGVFGYGQDGPYADLPAYDDLIQGAVGIPTLVGVTGDGTPRYVPLVFVDRTVGAVAVNSIIAALYHRERTGKGQSIEVPMFETMVPFVLGEHMRGQTYVPPIGGFGYQRLLAPERRPYKTRDGYICAVVYTDRHWDAFYEITGRAGKVAADPRLCNIGERTRHMAALCQETADVFATDTTQRWMERLNAADIPCMRLHTPESLMKDPHLEAVGYFQQMQHPSEGDIWQMRSSVHSSETPHSITRLAPRLGEHTREVLAEGGFTSTAIEALERSGAVIAEKIPPATVP